MIIFISGSINSGKSTVAAGLAARLEKSALVEIDRLREFVAWMKIEEAVPISLENAVSVIRNFSKKGLNVVVPYPLSERNYVYVMAGLRDLGENVLVFTLSPKIEKALSDTNERMLDEWERERIRHHYDIGIPFPSFGVVVDNTNQTPEETVDEIFGRIINEPKP